MVCGQKGEVIMDGYFVQNMETGKIELHFDREDYNALDDAQKSSLKSAFLWGRKSGCWISRRKEPHLSYPRSVAESLGLENAGKTGERLSFSEQQGRKSERAERRAERFESQADHAEARGKALQKPIDDMRGDMAFFTQPNVNTAKGRAFTRNRDRMFAAFSKGFDEYRKSEYFRDRASISRCTADLPELKDSAFAVRRIRECESAIRKLKREIEDSEKRKEQIKHGTPVTRYDGSAITMEDVNARLESSLDRLEVQLDKLGYYQESLEKLGGVKYSKNDIKPGDIVMVKRFGACKVLSTGPKNFKHNGGFDCIVITSSYAEIESIGGNSDGEEGEPEVTLDEFASKFS